MNLKQLIKFGIEESSVPVIKNPILRAALEPRSAVHEPRNMYSQGQLVRNTVDGSRPGYGGYPPSQFADYGNRHKGFNQWLKDNKVDFKNAANKRDVVLKFERSQIAKNYITPNELARVLTENGSPYGDVKNFADQFRIASLKEGKDKVLNAKIKKAKKLVKIVNNEFGIERSSLKDIYKEFEVLSTRPTEVSLGTGKFPERYIKIDKTFNKKMNTVIKGLDQEFSKVGFRANTIDNIFSLYDDTKFMDELRKYKGGEVNPKSHLFKKAFQSGEKAYAFMQLGRVLKGEIDLEGITSNKNTGNKIIKSMAFDSVGKKYGHMWNASYEYAKFKLNPYLGKDVNYQTLSRSISQAFKEAGVTGKNIDEIFPLRTGRWGVGKGSDAYSNFVQFIDKEINQGKKVAFDRTATRRYNKIMKRWDSKTNKFLNPEEVTELVGEHDAAIEKFYKENPKAKGKVNLTQLRWDSKTNKFLSPKQVFESQYKGSYKTIPEKIRKGMEKFYTKTGLSLDPGTARTLEGAQREIKALDQKGIHKFLKQAGFNINKCLSEGGRVKLKLGKGVNTCITGVINDEMKLARKSGNTAKFSKFGKLASKAGWVVGWIDIPIELAFVLPSLLAGDVQGAKRATTAGLFGYGGKRLEQIDQEKNPEAYKYFKHVQDINVWMDAFSQQQDAEAKWGNVSEEYLKKYQKEGDPSGVMDRIVDQYDKAVATQKYIQENYKGYVNEEGEEDPRLIDLGKEEGKKYLREETAKEWKSGMDIDITMPDALPGGINFNVAPFKPDEITSLEQQIKQKGEPYYGKWWKRGVRHKAEELGKPELYDDWYDAFYGKDPRDAHSSLPLEWTDQLAELEKKELYQSLADKLMRPGGAELKESLIEQGFDFEPFREYNLQTTAISRSEGGLANLTRTVARDSRPMEQGLRSLYINDKDY